MANKRRDTTDDSIKEAVLRTMLRAPVKIYYPKAEEEPDGVLVTGFQHFQKQATKQDLAPRPKSPESKIEVILCEVPSLPSVLNEISSHLNCSSFLNSQNRRLQIGWNISVGQLRRKVRHLFGYEESILFGLWFDGMPLSDSKYTIDSVGIRNGSVIELRLQAAANDDNDDDDNEEKQLRQVIYVKADLFDTNNDDYYTKSRRSANRSLRDGKDYQIPIGWKQYGLKVSGVYDNDLWFTADKTENGEWPICYSASKAGFSGKLVADAGYKPRKVQAAVRKLRDQNKQLCTPSIAVAEAFAETVTCNGNSYLFVFMNRINPREMVKDEDPDCPIWGADSANIRPYALLVKLSDGPNDIPSDNLASLKIT